MTIFIGSCADDSIGIGTQIVGEQARKVPGDYPYEILSKDNWIPVYDIVSVAGVLRVLDNTKPVSGNLKACISIAHIFDSTAEDDTLSFFSPSIY